MRGLLPLIEAGQPAPDFEAQSTHGRFALRERIAGGPLVLFFFPKADTPG